LGTILTSATVAGEILRAKMRLRPGEGIFLLQKTAFSRGKALFQSKKLPYNLGAGIFWKARF
jgi:hypothetical protein